MNFYYNICIIGCGGTGGNFAARLSQFLSNGYESSAQVILVDGDHVEESNIARQPFVSSELLLNKAVALAAAIEETYSFEVTAYPHYMDTVDELKNVWSIFSHSGHFQRNGEKHQVINVLIGCCDNHRCRQVMEKFFSLSPSLIYIDAANELSEGEVVIGIRLDRQTISPSRKFYFPEVMKSRKKRKSEESCGAVNIHHPQHLATNCFAANILLTIAAKLISEHQIDGGMIVFDTFKYSCLFRKYEVSCDE